jgi:hypothetical protein
MKITFYSLLCLKLLFLSNIGYANDWCKPSKAPSINIKTSTDNISYDFNLSEKQLNKFDSSTVNPYGSNVITDVGGLMKGGIETKHQMSFATLTNPRTKQMCFWYDKVEVSLHIRPKIYVARDFPKGSCMHSAILGHEHKHVIVDREIVNKYAALIGDALKYTVARNPVFGPISTDQKQIMLDQVKINMQNIVQEYISQMSNERKQRQQAVDNLAEYERVNKSCKR